LLKDAISRVNGQTRPMSAGVPGTKSSFRRSDIRYLAVNFLFIGPKNHITGGYQCNSDVLELIRVLHCLGPKGEYRTGRVKVKKFHHEEHEEHEEGQN
jgi:hypothetical protein